MKNIHPKVTLINDSGLTEAYIAAKNCTSPKSIEELIKEATEPNKDVTKLLKAVIIDNGHLAIAEFIHFSFAIEGINLATAAQYNRHRLQSLAQKSSRYITHKELVTSLPIYMENDQRIHELNNRSYELYNELIDDGMLAEAARLVLPQNLTTTVVCKLNARELIHVLGERECNCAQDQIKDVAKQMHQLAKQNYSFIFDYVGPKCYNLGRCPEKRNSNGCGLYKLSPYWKE